MKACSMKCQMTNKILGESMVILKRSFIHGGEQLVL